MLDGVAASFVARLEANRSPVDRFLYSRGISAMLGVPLWTWLGLSPREFPGAPWFANRLTLPLWNAVGDVVGFRGRVWEPGDQRPKALGWPAVVDHYPLGVTPETYLVMEKRRFAVLVEGEMDMLSLWYAGVPAVATCGTSLPPATAYLLAELVDCLLIWPDADAPGQIAAGRFEAAMAPWGVSVGWVTGPPGAKDANDVLHAHGPGAVQSLVAAGVWVAAAGEGGEPCSC